MRLGDRNTFDGKYKCLPELAPIRRQSPKTIAEQDNEYYPIASRDMVVVDRTHGDGITGEF